MATLEDFETTFECPKCETPVRFNFGQWRRKEVVNCPGCGEPVQILVGDQDLQQLKELAQLLKQLSKPRVINV